MSQHLGVRITDSEAAMLERIRKALAGKVQGADGEAYWTSTRTVKYALEELARSLGVTGDE